MVVSMFMSGWGSRKAQKAKRIRANSRIYFFQQGASGPIKIGWSSNPSKRLVNVQVSNPYPIRMIGTYPGTEEDEARLHECFSMYRIHGEWFRPSEEILAYISDVLKIPLEELKGE